MTIKETPEMMNESKSKYLNGWATEEDMLKDFDLDKSELEGTEILIASYTQEGYEGSAFVLFKKDGKLFAVTGGHCSCYGLEGQWDPKETNKEELEHLFEKGTYGEEDNIKSDALEVIKALS